MNQKKTAGFTLVELLIAVVILGIIASVAIPNYTDYVRQGALSEAFSNLADFRVKLEQFYQSNRKYGTTDCGNDGTAARINFTISNAKFTYTCTLSGTGSAQTYLLTATGNSGTSASGHVFTLDTSNSKATTTFKGSAVTKACWLRKGNEC